MKRLFCAIAMMFVLAMMTATTSGAAEVTDANVVCMPTTTADSPQICYTPEAKFDEAFVEVRPGAKKLEAFTMYLPQNAIGGLNVVGVAIPKDRPPFDYLASKPDWTESKRLKLADIFSSEMEIEAMRGMRGVNLRLDVVYADNPMAPVGLPGITITFQQTPPPAKGIKFAGILPAQPIATP